MLQLGSKTFTVDGVTVFADHEPDSDQWWYLAAPVRLARRPPDDRAQLTLIMFTPEVRDAGVEGGGFLMIETELVLDEETERRIRARCRAMSGGEPRLAPVQLDSGTVQCIALNLQGPGGTAADRSTAGPLTFVREILGADEPSLQGNNSAAFSLVLDEAGAKVLEEAFRERGAPIGVIYDLSFTALRPSLDVEITADFSKMYESLKVGVDFGAAFPIGGLPIFLQAGIDAAFETMKQDGAITIKVVKSSSSADAADQERWALEFFKSSLLADWFKPTLAPVKFDSATSPGTVQIPGLGSIPSLGGVVQPPAAPAAPGGEKPAPGGEKPAPGGEKPAPGGEKPAPGGGGEPGSGGAAKPILEGGGEPAPGGLAEALPEAQIAPIVVQPDAVALEHAIRLSNAGEQRVTLTFEGGDNPPLVTIDGVPRSLDEERRLQVDVAAGASLAVRAEHPAAAGAEGTFHLHFEFDKPSETPNTPFTSSPRFLSYLGNHPVPPDPEFTSSDGQPVHSGASGEGGADALRSWIQRLGEPRQVVVDGHASWENRPETEDLNRRLSERRRQIAAAIIGLQAEITGGAARGFEEAREVGNRMDRVAKVVGRLAAGDPVVITTTLSRPTATGGGTTTPGTGGTTKPGDGTTKPGDGTTKPGDGTTTPGTGGTTKPGDGTTKPGDGTTKPGTSPAAGDKVGIGLTFQLQHIEQEELKTLTFSYNRTEAVQQSWAPQGFIGLMAGDLGPGHLILVDLDSAFFRTIPIVVETPGDYEKIGLRRVDVKLSYGRATDREGVKEKDFTFSGAGPRLGQHSFSLNARRELSYEARVSFHFDPQSDWRGERFDYELPAETTQDRTLLLHPFDRFGFREIRIIPGDIDASAVASTDVHLSYDDGAAFRVQDVITVEPGGPEQFWRLRLSNPERTEVGFVFEHHLVDGTTQRSEPSTTDGTTITVNDSFPDALELDLIPTFPAGSVRTVFTDILYEDPGHQYRREAHVEFAGGDPQRQHLRIALFDPGHRTYRLTHTILGVDGSIRRLEAETDAERVFVGETF